MDDDKRCQTNGCNELQTFVVFWPGQETRTCDAHKRQLQHVAEAMGFAVSSRRLDGEG